MRTLKIHEEEERQAKIGELEQTQNNLGEDIRLDLLVAGRREATVKEEASQTNRLEQLSRQKKDRQIQPISSLLNPIYDVLMTESSYHCLIIPLEL